MLMSRRSVLLGAAAGTLVAAPARPRAQGAVVPAMPARGRRAWAVQVPQIRIGLLGGENESDRLARYESYRKLIEDTFGVPTRVFPAGDYAGVMQGFAARQLEIAGLGASGYAGIWLDTSGNIEPLVVAEEADGSIGYYSVMVVRTDSGITNLAGMRGKALAWADPNSTSGYLVPRAELREGGIDPEPGRYFSRTGFGGGHEQAVVAVLNRQYDGAVTWTSGIGDVAQGHTRGNLHEMVQKGMLRMSDLRIIWQSRQIVNGPIGARKDLPQAFKDDLRAFHLAMAKAHPDIYRQVERGSGTGYRAVQHALFEPIIAMRRAEAQARRAR